MERCFPKLKQHQYEVTSVYDEDYNCIAFAAEDEDSWWWPADPGDAYWPPGVPRWETLETFVQAFATLGYERCANGMREPGFQKFAIYADARGVPTHAARQSADGTWLSKLGKCEDIRHENVSALEESEYGKVAIFLKRSVSRSN
jgi:hypothetical protein